MKLLLFIQMQLRDPAGSSPPFVPFVPMEAIPIVAVTLNLNALLFGGKFSDGDTYKLISHLLPISSCNMQ